MTGSWRRSIPTRPTSVAPAPAKLSPNESNDDHADRRSYPLSPDLPLAIGRHSLAGLPGCFADSAPDRWGRNLIAKRIRAQARGEGRQPGSIQEVDSLLGVSDLTRQGALRFALADAGPYLDADEGVPQLVALPRLLRAADAVVADGDDDLAAVKELLDAGSGSLGGDRPKASVQDGDKLLIVKFPHHGDEWDVMAWEKTGLDLAERCGIRVPHRRLVDVGGRNVLLLDRFDRGELGRVGYISAMTLLRASDGDQADYLEVAEALSEHGSRVSDDLAELWRRIAFSLIINNVDDHLRNHGFLRDAADFGLAAAGARSVWEGTLAATAHWRDIAAGNGITDAGRDRFAPAHRPLPQQAPLTGGRASRPPDIPRAAADPDD